MSNKNRHQVSGVRYQDKTGDIYLIAAMEIEVKPLLSGFRKVGKIGPGAIFSGESPSAPKALYLCETNLHKTWLVISGVGNQCAVQTAQWVSRREPKLVLSLGYAGGLSPSLARGEVFVPQELRNAEGKCISCDVLSNALPIAPKGALLTMDRVIQSREEKAAFRSMADAVDMETFPIANVMNQHGIPFASIRVISDTSDESLPIDFTGILQGRKALFWGAINLLAQNPLKIPAVIKLGLRSRRISNRLSKFSQSVLEGLYGRSRSV